MSLWHYNNTRTVNFGSCCKTCNFFYKVITWLSSPWTGTVVWHPRRETERVRERTPSPASFRNISSQKPPMADHVVCLSSGGLGKDTSLLSETLAAAQCSGEGWAWGRGTIQFTLFCFVFWHSVFWAPRKMLGLLIISIWNGPFSDRPCQSQGLSDESNWQLLSPGWTCGQCRSIIVAIDNCRWFRTILAAKKAADIHRLNSPIICWWTSESRASQTSRWLFRQMWLIERNECIKAKPALMEAVIGWHGGLQQPSHWLWPSITIGELVWKAAHDLIKTTVDCACGNELVHQSQCWEVKVKGCLTQVIFLFPHSSW